MFQSYFNRFSNVFSRKNRASAARRRGRAAAAAGRAAAAPLIDRLESRVLHAVFSGIVNGQLRITDTSAADVITLDHSGTTTFVNEAAFPDSKITNGISMVVGSGVGGLDTVNIKATVKPVTLDGQFDVKNLNIGKSGSVQGIGADVFFKNLDPTSLSTSDFVAARVKIDDSADPDARSVKLDIVNQNGVISGLAPGKIKFFDEAFQSLDIFAGKGNDTFNILHTPEDFGLFDFRTAFLSIYGGSGSDTINLLRNNSDGVGIHGQGGNNTVNIGNNGSVQAIKGTTFVFDDGGGLTDVNIDNSLDITKRTVTLDHQTSNILGTTDFPTRLIIHDLAPGELHLFKAGINSVQVRAGGGGNTFNVKDTIKNSLGGGNTILDTGVGVDTTNVFATAGKLTVNGQSGRDFVKIGKDGSMLGIKGDVHVTNTASFSGISASGSADSVSRIITLDNNGTTETITGLAANSAKLSYVTADVNSLILNSGKGADTIFVRGTRGLAQPIINAGLGDDLVVVASAGNNLDPILSPVSVFGGGGFDRLLVNDQGNHLAHTYTTTTSSVTRTGNGPTVTVNYFNIDDLDVLKSTIPTGNPPPLVKDLAFPGTVTAGKFATLTGRLSDADGDTKLTLAVDWGDGSQPTLHKPGQKPFSVKHKYRKAGTYSVRVIWTDSKGESNFRDLYLVVESANGKK